ncbi:hypothetical protein EYC95_13880 [Pseudomonas sp. BGI-2]|nr:hypothetical protein EYC95_13880 [Pseudomonas sp. BGI-2]
MNKRNYRLVDVHQLIVPTLCVGMQPVTLCVTSNAERPLRHSHAERGNDRRPEGRLFSHSASVDQNS